LKTDWVNLKTDKEMKATTYSLTHKNAGICAYTIFAIALLLPNAVQAQNETGLNRELTLEREYDPSVRDANKVNTLPEVKAPAVAKSAIDYAFLSLPTDPKREIGLLSSGKYKTGIDYDKRRGYFNLGAGNYLNINGDAGYHILSSEKDILNVYLSHRSTNGDVKYINDFMKGESTRARINDNLASLRFLHKFSKATLKLNAGYGYSLFNYYGLPDPSPYSVLPQPQSVDTKTNQAARRIAVETGVQSVEGTTSLNYYADLRFNSISYKYGLGADAEGVGENMIGARFGLSAAVGGVQWVGADASFDYFHYVLPASHIELENFLAGRIMPYYKQEGDFWNLTLGANILFFTGSKAKVFASPNLAIDLNLGAKTILYAKLGGGLKTNNLLQMAEENRYIDTYSRTLPSRTLIDALIGLKSGVAPGFWFNLFGGYKYTADDYFFIPNRSWMGFGNLSHTMALNSRHLYGGLELKYALHHLFEIRLKGVYNHWQVSDPNQETTGDILIHPRPAAYGRPRVEGSAGLLVRPIDPLAFSLDYYLASGRVSRVGWNEAMADIHELGLTSSYRINNSLGLYLKLNNILDRKYEVIYGYPLQGFHFIVGFNLNF
jgi:hypothetical protein